jgi:hypothetical protein
MWNTLETLSHRTKRTMKMGDLIVFALLPMICGALGGAFVVWLMLKNNRLRLPTWANHDHDWRGR